MGCNFPMAKQLPSSPLSCLSTHSSHAAFKNLHQCVWSWLHFAFNLIIGFNLTVDFFMHISMGLQYMFKTVFFKMTVWLMEAVVEMIINHQLHMWIVSDQIRVISSFFTLMRLISPEDLLEDQEPLSCHACIWLHKLWVTSTVARMLTVCHEAAA